MAYQDIALLQSIATGQPFAAATLQQIRDNDEFLIDPPVCSIKETTPQSVADNTWAILTSNEETFDNDSMHNTTSNTSRITFQTAGRYLLVSTMEFASDVNGHRQFEFFLNGATSYGMTRVDTVTTGGASLISGARPFVFTAGQYAEVRALHLAGGALNVTLLDFSAYFMTR